MNGLVGIIIIAMLIAGIMHTSLYVPIIGAVVIAGAVLVSVISGPAMQRQVQLDALTGPNTVRENAPGTLFITAIMTAALSFVLYGVGYLIGLIF